MQSTICYQQMKSDTTAKPVSQDSKGQIRETGHHTEVADPILVASGKENADAVTHHPPKNTINNIPSQQPIGETSSSRESSANHVSLIREQLENRGFSTTATEILESAWTAGTRKQCEGYLGRWRQYCGQQNINPFSPTVEEGINFLAELFEKGLGYSEEYFVVYNRLVCRLLKGVFETCPSLPRHNIIWEV